MILTMIIESLTEWIKENVCQEIVLMKPDDANMGSGYKEEYVHPQAYSLYIPAKDCLPPEVETKLPAVCIQLIDGKDDLISNEESLNIRLAFAVWNPGKYETIEKENEVGEIIEKVKRSRNADGWKDVWLFLDKTKHILQKELYLEDIKISKDEPMKFGFFSNEETMVNAYPEWYAWLSFKIVCGVGAKPNHNYDNLL